MNDFFGFNSSAQPFKLFSLPHIVTLVIILAANLLIFLFRNKLKEHKINKYLRYSLALALLLEEISLQIWHISAGQWSVTTSLPLHLCGVAIFLSMLMLVTKSFAIYEVVYFWGLGGAIQALFTPYINGYNYPHYRFFQFFLSHGLLITSALFMTFTHLYRPRQKSIFKTFGITNLYLIFIAVFNLITGANYLFICRKPSAASLLDFLGPWPWYILSLEFVALITFIIYYVPFAICDFFKKKKASCEITCKI